MEVSMKDKEYVLLFAFDRDDRVLLIRKNKPAWQAGRLNGLGGKVERGEWVIDTVMREFREEAGLYTEPNDWSYFFEMRFPAAADPTGQASVVNCYAGQFSDLSRCVGEIDEGTVDRYDSHVIPRDVLPNLHWLIPLARLAAYRGIQQHGSITFTEVGK
jgi:8-oxo-dGTP diphosphatase